MHKCILTFQNRTLEKKTSFDSNKKRNLTFYPRKGILFSVKEEKFLTSNGDYCTQTKLKIYFAKLVLIAIV